MNDFVKVFDLADSGFRSVGFASTGFIFIAIGVLMFFSPKILKKLKLQKSRKEPKLQTIFRFFFLGFAIFWTSTALMSTYGEYEVLRDAEYKVVEGKVENFDPMPYSGHKHESYTVQGVEFSYSDYNVTNGFNNTASHGGPVNQNSVVRIFYVPRGSTNIITRLEVKGYKGPIKNYSGGVGIFSAFEKLGETGGSGELDKEMKDSDRAMVMAQKYMVFLMPLFIADLALYALFLIPFYNIFFRVKLIEHEPLEIDSKYLNQEKHTLENLTVKYDGEGVIWGRPYGVEVMNSPGCALKMHLSRDKTKVIKSEIRMSTLMFLCFFMVAFMAMEFFKVTMSEGPSSPKEMSFFPYVMFPMIIVQFWMLKSRFQKKVNELLKNKA